MKLKWQVYLHNKNNKRTAIFTFLFLVFILFTFLNFLTYNEYRIGSNFNDPILKYLSPQNFSTFIFLITYSFGCLGLLIAFNTPQTFINLLQVYSILTILRIISLYLLPLEPPPGIIVLNDKLLQFSFYSGRDNLKDLFFSGHTATIFLFPFIFSDRRLKWLFSLAAISIGFLLVKQHVHYSIDVLFAPVFASIAVVLQRNLILKKNTDACTPHL